MIRLLPLLLLPLLASPALAIDLQPTAKPYEPIVITHDENTTIQILPWGGAIPRFLDEAYIKRPIPELTIFCAPPGAYIVFGGGSMGIIIIEGTPPTPPGPGPGPGPDPPPPVPSQIQEVSRQGATALNDPQTTAALITAMTAAVNQTRGSPLEAQVEAVKAAISTTLLNRQGASRQKDWLNLWRKPVDNAVAPLNPSTNYIQIIEAVIEGLKQAPLAATSPQRRTETEGRRKVPHPVSVVVFSAPNCGYCIKWDHEVAPALFDINVPIEKKQDLINPVPYFQVHHKGRTIAHQGFMSLEQFTTYANHFMQ